MERRYLGYGPHIRVLYACWSFLENRIKLNVTPTINCETTKKLFKDAKADVGLSLGNSYISKSVYSIPKYGMLNIHGEILPEFKGAQSIIWPIYKNQSETGFTIHQIDNKIDTGDILHQEKTQIEFHRTLKETVIRNLDFSRTRGPLALSYVCENYKMIKERALKQFGGETFTTPSLRQFLKMTKNNRAMFKSIKE